MPVTLNMIPATLQEFQTCPQMDLSKPENTCAMFLCALQLYIKDRDGAQNYQHTTGRKKQAFHFPQFLERICQPPRVRLHW